MNNYFGYFIKVAAIITMSYSCSHQLYRSPQGEQTPVVSVNISPIKSSELLFHTEGSIYPCVKSNEPATILLPSNANIKISHNGVNLQANTNNEITVKCENDALKLSYEGTITLNKKMCEVSDEEVYCRPKSYPNPEVYADRTHYNISFNLPSGISALTPDANLSLNNGILFQIAKFSPAIVHKTAHFSIEYIFPESFKANTSNFQFVDKIVESYYEKFGPLAFDNIRVGAIRRDEKTGSISGTPGGNLILFSRTIFGAPADLKGLEQMGITRDISDAFRKMIIAHELSHFWFSDRFYGHDGWMVEGIPNYLGLIAVKKNLPDDFSELLKYFKYFDGKGSKSSIPNRPFGGGDDYIKAYYQGPLALYQIGENVGHDAIIKLIADVYQQNPDPSFQDFDTLFISRYPDRKIIWRKAWRLDQLNQ